MQFSNASRMVAAALSDTVAQPSGIGEALYITAGGVVAGQDAHGNAFSATLPAGVFPLRVKRVDVTSTTATGIFFLY